MATTDYLAPVLQIVGIVGLPAIAYYVNRGLLILAAHTKLRLTDQQRALVLGAASRGAGIAYDALASYTLGTDPAKVREKAFKAGVDYMAGAAPAAIAALGISNATVENMVRGELGKLLATDPAVTVAPVLTAAPSATPAS